MCAVIYDSRKYRQVDGGMYPFVKKNRSIRCLRWTLLEEIGSGKKFIVTNTHWELKVPRRLNNSRIMAQSLKELQKRFSGIPFFCTGDYNSSIDSQEFENLLKSTGFKDAALAAERAENTAFHSAFHPDERKIRSDKANIDHIVFFGDVKALSAKMLVGEILFKASDHFPIVVDFKI
jgi:endonuclease/exonuclease/phosphatase family metal-dependent hydrolase